MRTLEKVELHAMDYNNSYGILILMKRVAFTTILDTGDPAHEVASKLRQLADSIHKLEIV
jgi:hypothetical protein